VAGGILLVVVVGLALWLGLSSSSPHQTAPTTTSTAPASATASAPASAITPKLTQAQVIQAATRNHDFIKPECPPVAGPHWVFPGASHFESTLYESYAIKYSCGVAATWIKRIAATTVAVSTTNQLVPLAIGPRGYSCGAWPDANGHAYAGGCANPKLHSSFGWNWNVADPRHVFKTRSNGSVYAVKVSGGDSITTLRLLHGQSYKLILLNTSGVGFIHTFTWVPPTGWEVNSLTGVHGANCRIDGGDLSCVGLVTPPTCLCSGDGGKVVVYLTIRGTNHGSTDGHPVYYGNEGEMTELKSMIPVPFLIPGTHIPAARVKKNQ
jgi:hypothetical protein